MKILLVVKILLVLCCLAGWGLAANYYVAASRTKVIGEQKRVSLAHAQGREVMALQGRLFDEATANFQRANTISSQLSKKTSRLKEVSRIPELQQTLADVKQDNVDLKAYIGKAYYYLVCLDEIHAEIKQAKSEKGLSDGQE